MVANYDLDAIQETLERDGFCVIPDMLSKEQCAAARAALDRIAADDAANNVSWIYDEGSNQRLWALINREDEVFVPLATHPLLMELMERLLGPAFTLSSIHANITGPGGLAGTLHLDQSYMPEPMTRSVVYNSVWMIDEFTAENGATCGIAGSHKLQRFPKDGTHDAKPVPMTGSEGSLLLMDGRFWHHTGANVSNVKRRGVFGVYHEYWVRGLENWARSLPPELLDRYPQLAKLLGFVSYNTFGSVNGPEIELLPKTESVLGVTMDVQTAPEKAKMEAAH